MKKIIIVILLTIASKSYTQVLYFNYLDYTSEWRYYVYGFNGINGYDDYETRYFEGDTTLNGVAYYKEFSNRVLTDYNIPVSGTNTVTNYFSGPYFLREDPNGKFYRFNPNDGLETIILDNQEILNSQLGDPFPYPGATCSIQTIETVNLSAASLKKIKGVNVEDRSGTLEGVGVVGLACANGIESAGGLNCYTKQGINLQFYTIDCDSFPLPIRQTASLNPKYNNEKLLHIFPNPTTGIIRLKFDSEETLYFEVYNIQGRICQNKKTIQKEQIIDISDFSDGTYFLKIVGLNSNQFVKIVKE